MHTIPFQITEDDSVTFYWIDIFPNDFCMTAVNASIEYMSREPVPLCPQKHDGYVVSSAEAVLNQTIMYSAIDSSICDNRVLSIPSSCGGSLSTASVAVSSNIVNAVHSSAVHFSVLELSSLHIQTSAVHSTVFQTSAVNSTAVSTAIYSSSVHSTAFQTSAVHSTASSTAIHSSSQFSSFHSTAIHSSTSFFTTILPTSIPQSTYMPLFFLQ